MKDLFELCTPRKDVLRGHIKESDFAADLAQVINNAAPPEYQDPVRFFEHTYPTHGLKELLKNVCLRLLGQGGEAASIFRLDTQYGGGKTHALIALTHTARGMQGVKNVNEFISSSLLPKTKVRVASFDGENADPINGRPLGKGLRAYTPWGEIAYALADVEGFESVRASDHERVAPGAENIRSLFGGQPTLILLDELSIYLRKVKGRPEALQLTPFLTALFKAVESSPGAVLVFTLAVGKMGKATDAYSSENEFVARQMDEAQSVAARKATVLDPTSEHETAQVVRRRLFANIDDTAAVEVISNYAQLWRKHADNMPTEKGNENREADFRNGYPLHPALMNTLTNKLSTLANFQRVRGMLRLLTQAVARLWEQRPQGTYAIHLHHLDPSFEPTRNEIITRLEMANFDPAIRNDVASVEGNSLAQQLDTKHYSGLAPYTSYVSRNVLWHSFAFNEDLKGIANDELLYSIVAPGLDTSFVNDARQKFVAESAYLDDRPSVPLRFLTEANLNQIIRRAEDGVDPAEVRTQLQDRIRTLFSGGKDLNLVPFASGPYDVDDTVGDGRPYLVLISHDALTVSTEVPRVPEIIAKIFENKGSQGEFRERRNNVVFLVADEMLRDEMKAKMVRRLALESLRRSERLSELAEHQQQKVNELYQRSEQELALVIQQCYRHLFYPTKSNRLDGSTVDLGHTAFDVPSASERPGAGQQQVIRALKDMNKLRLAEDHPLAPAYVRDQTPLKKGQLSTAKLRAEFREDPRFPILMGDENFIKMVRNGIAEGLYVYQRGDLMAGEGDPPCEIMIDEQSFVFTMTYAKEQNMWPRPPRRVRPMTSEVDVSSKSGEEGKPRRGNTGEYPIVSTSTPPGVQVFSAEAPLREALSRIWEQARKENCKRISVLNVRVFEADDAFRLLSAIASIPDAQKSLQMTGEYETDSGSNFTVEFRGIPKDAEPLKEFLVPQFRAAKNSGGETNLETLYCISFQDGLALDGDTVEKFTERLARFATGAVFVQAQIEATS